MKTCPKCGNAVYEDNKRFHAACKREIILDTYTGARRDFVALDPESREHERLEQGLIGVYSLARTEALREVQQLLHIASKGDGTIGDKVSNAYWIAYNHVNKELSK